MEHLLTQELLLSFFAVVTAILVIVILVMLNQKRVLKEQIKQSCREVNYNKQMLLAQIESQENERTRVAKDLHDDVGLMLQALRTTTLAVLQQAPEEDRKEVQQIVTEVDESVRRICWDLMPSSLQYFGLTEAVDELCHRLSARGIVPVIFSFQGTALTVAKNKQVYLYRIVQELAENALKHAHATSVEVKFTWTKNALQINVLDNGIGFRLSDVKKPSQPLRGLGLLRLENLANLLPSFLMFENNFPQGTNISVNYLIAPHAEN
jgi:two-component system, NarL family, sensor kinase